MIAPNHQNLAVTRPFSRADIGLFSMLLVMFAASLAATIHFCLTMSGGMSMPGGWTMSMMWMPMDGQTWLRSTVMFLEMWLAMMVAMMLPSSMPMFLRFARGRRSANPWLNLLATWAMMAGYFFVWMVAGVVIYVGGIFFAMAAMRWVQFSRTMPLVLGAAVVAAGFIQFLPWTMLGLSDCRGPSCGRWQSNVAGRSAWGAGVGSGVSCVTCCAGPTLLLLSLGMMNPMVIVLVSIMVAAEKLLPRSEHIVHVSGGLAIVAGVIIIGRLVY